jgi:glutamate-1-semialdehyde 2,1-aminomutase
VAPDLTILGKVIGGGMPIGGFGGRAEAMSLLAPGGPVYQAGTMAGHPVAMTAGEAMLAAATPSLYRRLERLGARLERGLRLAAADAGVQASVARVASLLTVFFRGGVPRDLAEAEASDGAAFTRFHAGMWARGVLIPPSRFEAWFISGAHREGDIDAAVAASREAFAEAA